MRADGYNAMKCKHGCVLTKLYVNRKQVVLACHLENADLCDQSTMVKQYFNRKQDFEFFRYGFLFFCYYPFYFSVGKHSTVSGLLHLYTILSNWKRNIFALYHLG